MDDEFATVLTVYGEARGEEIDGQVAVASVIRNRVNNRKKSYIEICFEPNQFSCWNEHDPNRKILDIIRQEKIPPDNVFIQIQYLVAGVMTGKIIDNTKGSEHYLERALFYSTKRPSWARITKDQIQIRNHVFFTPVKS